MWMPGRAGRPRMRRRWGGRATGSHWRAGQGGRRARIGLQVGHAQERIGLVGLAAPAPATAGRRCGRLLAGRTTAAGWAARLAARGPTGVVRWDRTRRRLDGAQRPAVGEDPIDDRLGCGVLGVVGPAAAPAASGRGAAAVLGDQVRDAARALLGVLFPPSHHFHRACWSGIRPVPSGRPEPAGCGSRPAALRNSPGVIVRSGLVIISGRPNRWGRARYRAGAV